MQELQQRLEARKAGRLKRLFDNSDGENDNEYKHWAVKALFKTFVNVHIITLPRWTDQNTSSSESSISKMRYETTEVLFFAHTGAHGYLLLVLLHHSVFAIFETHSATLLPSFQHFRGKKREALQVYPNPVTLCIFKLIFWAFSVFVCALLRLCRHFYSHHWVIFSFSWLICVTDQFSFFVCVCVSCFFSERKRESEKLTVVPKKSSLRRQKVLQAEKVAGLVFFVWR